MGFIKDAKAATALSHAARALDEGRGIFLYRFNVPFTSSGWSGPLSGAAEVIESIEAQGWQLSQLAYDESQSKNGAVLIMFRKSPAATRRDTP